MSAYWTGEAARQQRAPALFLAKSPSQRLLSTYQDAIQDGRYGTLPQRAAQLHSPSASRNDPQKASRSAQDLRISRLTSARQKLASALEHRQECVSSYTYAQRHTFQQNMRRTQTQWPSRSKAYNNQYTNGIFDQKQAGLVNEILLVNQLQEERKVQHTALQGGLLR